MATAVTLEPASASVASSSAKRSVALIVMGAVLLAVALLSLFVGSGDISVAEAWNALWHDDGSTTAQIIRTSRVPRTLLGIVCGAALGVAGAMMQALTRNPLADPGILGVNAGAYLMMVLGFWWFGAMSTSSYALWAMGGALLASAVVYVVGASGRNGASAGKLVLTGVAVSCVFTGVAFGLTMIDPKAFDAIRGWQAGSLQKSGGADILLDALPYIAVGLVMALLLTVYLNSIALGDDRARSLGVPVTTVRTTGFIALTLLCGAATAAIGPISFLGLMVPHAVRAVVGPDQRWIIPTCLLCAPTLFLGADIIGRVAVPSELPVGMVTAFLGAPVLIWLARKRGVNEL